MDTEGLLAVFAILLAISLGALWAARTRPYVAFGWIWYLVTLLPVIGLLLGKVDFSNLFINLSAGSYATLAEANPNIVVVLAANGAVSLEPWLATVTCTGAGTRTD